MEGVARERAEAEPSATMTDENDLSWPELHRRLVPLMRADNLTNIRYILLEYLVLAVSLACCVLAYRAWSEGKLATAGFVPLAALGMFAVAAVQHRLSGLGHEASHYTMFRNKVANELASDVFCMFPLMAMTQQFRATHLGHHRYVNDPQRDPDLMRLNRPVPMRWPLLPWGFVKRYLFAMLPHYRMAEAHAILMQHPPYREQVTVCRGFFFRTIGTRGPSVLDELARMRIASEPAAA